MSRPRMLWGAACVLALLSGQALADSQLKLYPIPGLFVAAPEQGGALVHPEFKGGVDNVGGGQYFEAEFRKRFPGAVSTVREKDKRSTLVTSLQVSRASQYSIDKIDGTSDLFIPVSGSLYFTNPVSGEVLYTVSATYYHRATINGSGRAIDSAKLHAMFATAYHGLVGELLDRARQQFKPHTVAATVRREWNGLYILDRGQDAGIAKGDALADAEGNTLAVLFSAPGYAVGRAELGKIGLNLSFARETNLSLADIKKPRVLVLVDKAPEGFPPDVLRQTFTEVLGARAPLSVVNVNPLFADVLKTVFAHTGLSSDNSSKRELPDFFVRLSIPESRSFEMPTTLRHKTMRSYRTIATAELVDRSGRVLFAASGEDKIDDEVIAGMSFDNASRREVSVKNALLRLAERIGAELKFERIALPLQTLAPLSLRDEHGMLAQGENLTLYRNIGKVEGIAGDVLAPIQDLDVESVSEGAAAAVAGMPLTRPALPLTLADTVLLDASSAPRAVTRKRFAACGPAEQLGALALPAFGDIALNAFERNYRAPFYSSSFFGELQQLLGPESRFKSPLRLTMTAADYCVEPVYRIDVAAPQCAGDPAVCTDSASVRITLRIKKGAAIATRSGLETKMSSSGYLQHAAESAHQNSLATDLLAESGKLARDIAVKLNNEKLN